MKSFQASDNRVYGMDKQKEVSGLVCENKKISVKKTQNQLRVIQISREVDSMAGLKSTKKTNQYKNSNYQADYYLANIEKLKQYKKDYHIRKKYGL